MKSSLIIAVVVGLLWQSCVAPPVTKNEEPNPETMELLLHYQHYLQEVVGALEKDPQFKKKLDNANQDEIRSGKIATELEFVSHHVRNQLDEIKRQELNRLSVLNQQLHEAEERKGGGNAVGEPEILGHVDHFNPHTFEIEDLKKLISKTLENVEENDRKRREQFKEYKLHEEYEKLDRINHTNGEEREKIEKEYKEKEEKHKKHEPLHEPGHKAQLEEVWEEQDHMEQEFNPRTFFMLHDLDGNNVWDQNEVKALFIKELNKMYKDGDGSDMVERAEEMERMRETVFRQIDTNRDGLIDFTEFLSQTKREEYQQDHGWKGLDEQKPYTDEELEAYIREQQRLHPPPPYYAPQPGQGYIPPGGYNPNMPPPQGAYNPNMPPPQGAYNPNMPPPQGAYPNTYQGQYPQGNPQMNQGYPQQVPVPQAPPVPNHPPPVQAAPVPNQPQPVPVPNQAQAVPVQNQAPIPQQQVPVQPQPVASNQAQAQPSVPVQAQQQAQPNIQQPSQISQH